jgi:hypothetical protein
MLMGNHIFYISIYNTTRKTIHRKSNFPSNKLQNPQFIFPSINELILIEMFANISIFFSIIVDFSIHKARVSLDTLLDSIMVGVDRATNHI